MKFRILLFLAAVGLLFIPLSDAFSAIQVTEFSKKYSEEAVEEVAVPLEFNPIMYRDTVYWFAYITPQNTPAVKNLVLAIKQVSIPGDTEDRAELELNEEALTPIIGLDYDIETLKLLKTKGLAFDDLKNVIDSLRDQLENKESPILENLKSQTTEDYMKIDDALSDLNSAALDASSAIEEGMMQLENFQNTATVDNINLDDPKVIMDSYLSSVDQLMRFIGKADIYQKAVIQKQQETKDSTIASELAKLANLKVKDSILRSYNSTLSSGKREIEKRNKDKAGRVLDIISGILSRKAKTDAFFAYSRAKADIEKMLTPQNELSLKDCKLSNADLKKQWESINMVMQGYEIPTTTQYQKIPERVEKARLNALSLSDRLISCLRTTPTAIPTAIVDNPSGFNRFLLPGLLVAILIVAFFYLNGYMKKKPDEEQIQ